MNDDDELVKQLPQKAWTLDDVTAQVHAAMGEAFPGLTYTLNSRSSNSRKPGETHALEYHLSVRWEDGPNAAQVNRIVQRFGTVDYRPDGMRIYQILDDGSHVAHNSVRGVTGGRTLSAAVVQPYLDADYEQNKDRYLAFEQTYGERPTTRDYLEPLAARRWLPAGAGWRISLALEEPSFMPTHASPTAARVRIMTVDELHVVVERHALQQVAQQVALEQQAQGQAAPVAMGRRRL